MAFDDIKLYCGSCNLKVNARAKALKCSGECGKPFHINCINISDSDYNKFEDISDFSLWFCEGCSLLLDSIKTSPTTTTTNTNNVIDESLAPSEKPVCCDCFGYIHILTDKLANLSENFKIMSQNVSSVVYQQAKFHTVLESMTC